MARAPRNAGWWSDALDHPRRLLLRKILFQVHLWAGLGVGLLSTVAGLTGSAVVYREALDRVLAPSLYRVSAGPPLPLDTVLARVQHRLPAAVVGSVDIPAGSNPWVFRLTMPDGKRDAAYVDPVRGELLGVRGERQGLMNWLDALHTELLGGRVGTWVNGAGAVCLFALCLTGIAVWWPGHGRARRAARIPWPPRRRRLSWDLHTAGGFWISLPLAVHAFTCIFLCFGFGGLLVLLGGRAAEFNDLVTPPVLSTPCPASGAALEHARAAAAALHPGARDVFIILPTNASGSAEVFSRTARDLQTGRVAVSAFNPCSGVLLRDVDSRNSSPALRLTLFLDAMHFGLVGGHWTQTAWVGLGLTPGTLFVTGFLLWRRRVTARHKAVSRQPLAATTRA